MAKDPAFLFYPGDWLGGTVAFTRAHKGAYMDLLMAQFNLGHISLEEIQTILAQDFVEMWEQKLKAKFTMDEDGKFFNKRLEQEAKKRRDFAQSRRDNLAAQEEKKRAAQEEKDKAAQEEKRPHMGAHMGTHMGAHMDKNSHMGDHMDPHMGTHMAPHMENENVVTTITNKESITNIYNPDNSNTSSKKSIEEFKASYGIGRQSVNPYLVPTKTDEPETWENHKNVKPYPIGSDDDYSNTVDDNPSRLLKKAN